MRHAETDDLTAAWARFDESAKAAEITPILALFAAEPGRMQAMTVEAAGLYLDLSKQPLSAEGLAGGVALARAAGIEARRAALFAGQAVNGSEHRAVLHPALRDTVGDFRALGQPVSAEVRATLARMKALADDLRANGLNGRPLKAIVHIGIGGSDLGPRLVWEALRPLDAPIDLRFAANVDGSEIAAALHGLDPATTLVVAVSKTFTTQETSANATVARDWLLAALGEDGARTHFAAVSAAPDKAVAFGVDPDKVFAFWEWVGGRFSLWSAVSLSVAIGLGFEMFERLLAGAAAMDRHFLDAPLERNAPVLLAIAQVMNRDGLNRSARAVIPYARRLTLLPPFLQQLEMESNGKRVGADGRPVQHATAPVVFGDAGTNGQHAFFQQLHQGVDVVPLEFIAVAKQDEGPADLHRKLLSNVIAQAEALLVGKTEATVRAELAAKGVSFAEIETLAPQKTFPGDRPSTTIVLDRLTPESLGALIALYEHKVLVEGTIWGINSFDQWGVELGKSLANRVLGELEGGPVEAHDPSTTALIARLR
jgi:glucose-6-phosphate isomerase